MKTIADIKRKMTLGSQWHCIHHGFSPNWVPNDMGVRPVSIVQSNQVAFKTTKGSDSWITFPKKDQVVFHNENSFSIIDKSFGLKPLLTYTFINKGDLK